METLPKLSPAQSLLLRTAAIVAIEGNQTVGASLTAPPSGSPVRRIPTTQRFITGSLIGLA